MLKWLKLFAYRHHSIFSISIMIKHWHRIILYVTWTFLTIIISEINLILLLKSFDDFPLILEFLVHYLCSNSVLKMHSIEYIFKNVQNKYFSKQKMQKWPIGHHYLKYLSKFKCKKITCNDRLEWIWNQAIRGGDNIPNHFLIPQTIKFYDDSKCTKKSTLYFC